MPNDLAQDDRSAPTCRTLAKRGSLWLVFAGAYPHTHAPWRFHQQRSLHVGKFSVARQMLQHTRTSIFIQNQASPAAAGSAIPPTTWLNPPST